MDSDTTRDPGSETKSAPISSVTLAELQYHFEGLRGLVFLGLIGLTAALAAIDVCFLRGSMVTVRAQLENQRAQTSKMVSSHKKEVEPIATNFLALLQAYAATDKDFQPILDKYRLFLSPYMKPGPGPAPGPAK